jgi:hypothetical protein
MFRKYKNKEIWGYIFPSGKIFHGKIDKLTVHCEHGTLVCDIDEPLFDTKEKAEKAFNSIRPEYFRKKRMEYLNAEILNSHRHMSIARKNLIDMERELKLLEIKERK